MQIVVFVINFLKIQDFNLYLPILHFLIINFINLYFVNSNYLVNLIKVIINLNFENSLRYHKKYFFKCIGLEARIAC